jgi:hypothetical protein
MEEIKNNHFNNAINFSHNVQLEIIEHNLLPPYCNLEENNGPYVLITFMHPNSNTSGYIFMGEPKYFMGNENAEGFIHILCSIDNYDSFIVEITVDNIDEMIDIIIFCQSLLQYQPDVPNLDFARIPLDILNHRGIPNYLRILNLEANRNINNV